MIISRRHKYLFIQVPHTACTAVGNELRKYYDGKHILHKHANYEEFEPMASDEEKKYFTFATVRNPLDEVVSVYLKYLNDHKSNYTDPQKLRKRRSKRGYWISQRRLQIYRFVQDEGTDFEDFLKKFYWVPYTSSIDINEPYCDHIMRFEHISEDFMQVLRNLDIEPIRPLPRTNVTKNKDERSYLDFYNSDHIMKYATKIFGPFMNKWGYNLPPDWEETIATNDLKKYERMVKARRLYYWIYGFSKRLTAIVD